MYKTLQFIVFLVLSVFYLWVAAPMLGCGSSNVSLSDDPDSGGSSGEDSCDDTETTYATGDFAVTITGDLCRTPAPSIPEEGTLILSCTTTEDDEELARNTTDSTVDNTAVTCGTGDGAASVTYYCQTGVVYKEEVGEDAELYESITLDCEVDEEGEATMTEEELVVS